MKAVVQVPADLGADKAAEWFRTWTEAASSSELRIDLPDANLSPSGRVWLAAGIAARKRQGVATRLEGSAAARRSIESLQPVLDLRQARLLAEESASELERVLEGVAPSPLRMARFVFEELGANVVQHSDASETGFGALAGFPETRRFELAFADAGIGFLASLERNPEVRGRLQDESEALQLALGKGVSGRVDPRRNMGMGLGLLQDFADRIQGDLWVASGTALLRRRTAVGVRSNTLHSISPWQGAWIALRAEL